MRTTAARGRMRLVERTFERAHVVIARHNARQKTKLSLRMTIIYTMALVGLLGLALHFELYWAAGLVVAVYLYGQWSAWRAARRRRTPPEQ